MTEKPYIICVDDEKVVLNSLREQIKLNFGSRYNIEVAECGHEALSIYEELVSDNREIPVVICDYIMPDIKGDEVLKSIHEYGLETSKILLTGQASLQGIKKAVNEAKVFRYVAKPWENEKLCSVIEESLDFYYKNKFSTDENKKLKEKNIELKSAIKHKVKEFEDVDEGFAEDDKYSGKSSDSFTYKIAQDVSESLSCVKNGIDMLQKLKGNLEDKAIGEIQNHLQTFEEYFLNISSSIENLIGSIESKPQAQTFESVSDEPNEVLDKVFSVKTEIFKSVDELTNRIQGIEKLIKKEPKKIVAWDNEDILLFNLDEILFFSREGRSIIVVTKNGKYKVRKTISELEESLHENNFFRCHKSYLVNLKYVSRLAPWLGNDSYMTTIEGYASEIPVSRNYIKDMKRIFGI
ncbi:MAG: response regulator transcription factor [Clostridia bacterium]|nr:response regulator transcription factor [Clostridia bacterium]